MRQLGLFGQPVLVPKVNGSHQRQTPSKRPAPSTTSTPGHEADVQEVTKQEREKEKKRLCAQARRDAGLRIEAVRACPWLVCSHDFEPDDDDVRNNQHGILYKDSDGNAVPKESQDIRFRCADCHLRYQTEAKPPGRVDALVSDGRTPHAMRDNSLWLNHQDSPYHIETMSKIDAIRQSAEQQSSVDETMTETSILQQNYGLGVLWTSINECALSLVPQVRDLGDAWGVDLPAAMSHQTNLELVSAGAEYFRRQQRIRVLIARVISVVGDGSTDISDVEQEVIGTRYTWGGAGRNEFVALAELDLTKSRDGQSPDSQCLEECYDRVMNKLLHGTTGELTLLGAL